MKLTSKTLGADLWKRLYQKPIFESDGLSVTREQLASRYKCYSPAAARNLARRLAAMQSGLGEITTLADLQQLGGKKGVGATTLYAALCLVPEAVQKRIVGEAEVALPSLVTKAKKEKR